MYVGGVGGKGVDDEEEKVEKWIMKMLLFSSFFLYNFFFILDFASIASTRISEGKET